MYCRMCGNRIEETDHYCQHCGTSVKNREPSAPPIEETEIKEEVVFNPPYERASHFAEEDPSDGERSEPSENEEPEKELENFISEDEIEAQKEEPSETPEPPKNNEFTWDVYEFPSKTKKTDEIEFNWNLEDYSRPAQKEAEPAAFEEELFQEILGESEHAREQKMDRFFTFNRKNEEFQKLLDKEYEKFKIGTGPVLQRAEQAPSPAKEEPSPAKEEPIPAKEEPIPAKEEPIPAKEEPSPTVESSGVADKAAQPKAEHISEMTVARAQFFGEELICDNECIRKKLSPSETEEASGMKTEAETAAREEPAIPEEAEEPAMQEAIEEEPAIQEDLQFAEGDKLAETERRFPEDSRLAEAEHRLPEDIKVEAEEVEMEEEKRKGSVTQILLVIIAIILAAEILILGIRYFAPESSASKAIGTAQAQIYDVVSGWMSGASDLFSGDDEQTPSDGDDQNKVDDDQDGESADGQEDNSTPPAPAPDPNPTADKNALIASQLGLNKNIQEVKAVEALAYQSGKDYGLADINNSKPISNNIWQTPENGEPVYYDQAIVGTIIAFDSQWIDYVNNGDKSVLSLLKKDSKAYRNAVSFSKAGKITETFKQLQIGEIRQGSEAFYVWAYEEIQITEKGATRNQNYDYIYHLEPVDGKMQIINYTKYK